LFCADILRLSGRPAGTKVHPNWAVIAHFMGAFFEVLNDSGAKVHSIFAFFAISDDSGAKVRFLQTKTCHFASIGPIQVHFST